MTRFILSCRNKHLRMRMLRCLYSTVCTSMARISWISKYNLFTAMCLDVDIEAVLNGFATILSKTRMNNKKNCF